MHFPWLAVHAFRDDNVVSEIIPLHSRFEHGGGGGVSYFVFTNGWMDGCMIMFLCMRCVPGMILCVSYQVLVSDRYICMYQVCMLYGHIMTSPPRRPHGIILWQQVTLRPPPRLDRWLTDVWLLIDCGFNALNEATKPRWRERNEPEEGGRRDQKTMTYK